jgi:formamidopyrimidine-DNA glycosylase
VKYAVEVDADCDCFPVEWLFHHRWGKKPGKVNGEIVLKFYHELVIVLNKIEQSVRL